VNSREIEDFDFVIRVLSLRVFAPHVAREAIA